MSASLARARWRLGPRSLFGRLVLILFFGLVLAHALSIAVILYERTQAAKTMMSNYLSKDVASSVAVLEQVPAADRTAWAARLERPNYRYVLDRPPGTGNLEPADSGQARAWIAAISETLGPNYPLVATAPAQAAERTRLDLHLRLSDGTPLTIELYPSGMPLSRWLPAILGLQLATLAVFAWIAVRVATRPLAQLAQAADRLAPGMEADQLREEGPSEVVRAAKAFNAMQRRISDYLAERMQILAAVSHDLQTPITRMRLRADLMDDPAQREKLQGDLNAMQVLVEQGIAYARDARGIAEAPCRVDLDALLDSLACDYRDSGQAVRLAGRFGRPFMTRPHALRRIIINLVNNALKFGEDVEILVQTDPPDRISIAVMDRGPGIPPSELDAVLQPFYRLEPSRNRETGGAGLGLAIAQQLAVGLNGTLSLSNRECGGLEARLTLPLVA